MNRGGIIIIVIIICLVCLIGLGVGGYFAFKEGGPLNHVINQSPSPSSSSSPPSDATITDTMTIDSSSPSPSPSGMSEMSTKKTIRSSYNTCLGEDGGMYGCDSKDAKQQWEYDSSKKQLKSASSSKCLALYDGNNGSKPYSWDCDENDNRQKWTYDVPLLKSGFGSCLAIYDENVGSKPYGWSCNASDNRQNWNMA